MSNVIGAAALHGKPDMLEYCLNRLDAMQVDIKAIESVDRMSPKGGPFKTEMQDHTPLMLALVGPTPNVKVVQLLFGRDANHIMREPITNNNILHMTAKHTTNLDVVKYVFKNAKLDVFERNANGDTPLIVARDCKNDEVAEIIEQCQEMFDETGKQAEELMN